MAGGSAAAVAVASSSNNVCQSTCISQNDSPAECDRHIKQMLQLHFLLSTNNDFSLDNDRDVDIMLGPTGASVVPHETNRNLLRKMMQKDFGGLDGFKITSPNMLNAPLTLIAYLEYSVEVPL
ncbi:hypothetical protein TKK_0018953 [Trichogramma kaykai]